MKKKLLVAVALLFCISIFAKAEYFYLKNGDVINGKVVAETNSTVTVAVGSKRHKINISDIVEITSKPKPVAEPVKTSATPEEAKTQFASESKTELKDAETYVSDNQSGIVVYNVKETEIPVISSPTAVSSDEGNFDTTAYLLSGGESSDIKPQTSSANTSETDLQEDGYDPALYLLGLQSANFQEEQEQVPQEAAQKDEYEVAPVDEKKEKAMLRETFIGISFDLQGSHEFSGQETINGISSKLGEEDSDYGFSIAAEHYGYLSKYFALGVGVSYEAFRSLKTSPGKFSFLPIYLSVKIRPLKTEDYSVYAVIQGGYNILIANHLYLGHASSEGGFYYAGGVGFSMYNYVIQGLYSVNNARLSYFSNVTNINKDITFSKIGIYVGYLF